MYFTPINIIVSVANLFCGVLFIGLAIPLVRRRVAMNHLYGIRLKPAFESDSAWYDINEYGGRVMIWTSYPLLAVAIVTLFIRLEGRDVLTVILASAAGFTALVSCWLCWRYAKAYEGPGDPEGS